MINRMLKESPVNFLGEARDPEIKFDLESALGLVSETKLLPTEVSNEVDLTPLDGDELKSLHDFIPHLEIMASIDPLAIVTLLNKQLYAPYVKLTDYLWDKAIYGRFAVVPEVAVRESEEDQEAMLVL